MEARIGEARRHARELHRRAQERLAQRGAVGGVVVFGAVRVAPEERLVRLAAVVELAQRRCGPRRRPRRRCSASRRRRRSGRRAACPCRSRCRRRTRRRAAASRRRAVPRRRRPRTATNGSRRTRIFQRTSTGAGPEIAARRSPLRDDRQQVARYPRRNAIASSAAVVVGPCRQRLAGPQLIERPRRGIRAQERERVRIVDAHAREHAADRVAALGCAPRANNPIASAASGVNTGCGNARSTRLPRGPFRASCPARGRTRRRPKA